MAGHNSLYLIQFTYSIMKKKRVRQEERKSFKKSGRESGGRESESSHAKEKKDDTKP
jgi:hypothetical protein